MDEFVYCREYAAESSLRSVAIFETLLSNSVMIYLIVITYNAIQEALKFLLENLHFQFLVNYLKYLKFFKENNIQFIFLLIFQMIF